MKGEAAFREAIEKDMEELPKEPGSYYGVSPLRRSIIALGGPAMNVIFAFLAYLVIMSLGYDVKSWSNKVIIASDYDGKLYPADSAGLKSGDIISKLNDKNVDTFFEIQEIIALSANKNVNAQILRNGQELKLSMEPGLDKDSGAGRIGIYPWIDPIIENIDPNGPAALAGLKQGDLITRVDDLAIPNSMDLSFYLEKNKPGRIKLEYSRDSEEAETTLVLSYSENQADVLGLSWKTITKRIKADGALNALTLATAETGKTIASTYKGLGSLFLGVNLLKAISGPVRITWMVGSVTKDSLTSRQPGAFSVALGFLAVLSIGLFVMNLLPIPLLDGGALVLFILEWIRGKSIKLKTLMRYQTIGVIAIGLIFLLAMTGDLLFFAGK